jgi:hypothetical protein
MVFTDKPIIVASIIDGMEIRKEWMLPLLKEAVRKRCKNYRLWQDLSSH